MCIVSLDLFLRTKKYRYTFRCSFFNTEYKCMHGAKVKYDFCCWPFLFKIYYAKIWFKVLPVLSTVFLNK